MEPIVEQWKSEPKQITKMSYQQMAGKVEYYAIASGLLGVAGGFIIGLSPTLYDTKHSDWAPIAAAFGIEAVIGSAIYAGRVCRTIRHFYLSKLPPTNEEKEEERHLSASGQEGRILPFPHR